MRPPNAGRKFWDTDPEPPTNRRKGKGRAASAHLQLLANFGAANGATGGGTMVDPPMPHQGVHRLEGSGLRWGNIGRSAYAIIEDTVMITPPPAGAEGTVNPALLFWRSPSFSKNRGKKKVVLPFSVK